jgi:hypothetical protein
MQASQQKRSLLKKWNRKYSNFVLFIKNECKPFYFFSTLYYIIRGPPNEKDNWTIIGTSFLCARF